jgi:hypothetical protein
LTISGHIDRAAETIKIEVLAIRGYRFGVLQSGGSLQQGTKGRCKLGPRERVRDKFLH